MAVKLVSLKRVVTINVLVTTKGMHPSEDTNDCNGRMLRLELMSTPVDGFEIPPGAEMNFEARGPLVFHANTMTVSQNYEVTFTF